MTHKRIPYRSCPLCGGKEFQPVWSEDCTKQAIWREGLPTTMEWVGCYQ